ncbi:MAG: putative acyltransferase [Verrucomicrobiales bacterium]|jgi:predicted acyltransferase
MNSPNSTQRLASIDALRGFDMLMIAGAGSFFVLLGSKSDVAWVDAIAAQFKHPAWNGFTFYDFIFPLFMFMAGVSLAFSLNSTRHRDLPNAVLYKKAFKRMLILIGLGILYKNAPLPIFEPDQIRVGSVLGRIGFAGFVTTILYLNFSPRGRMFWIAGILLVYYAALYLVPVPEFGAGDLSFEGNLVGWFDRQFQPGRLLQKTYDELGLLTQFPALCLTMLGAIGGDILRGSESGGRKLKTLGLLGLCGIIVGLLWSFHFPINKHLWTSSFILLTGGMAFLALALFYGLIDVCGFKKWAFFFQVIGMNSLTIYLVNGLVDFKYTSARLFGGLYRHAPETWHDVWQASGALALVWLFLYFLYRNKLFLKV